MLALALAAPAWGQESKPDEMEEQAASAFGRQFLPTWQRGAAYLLAVAQAMPEEHYGYAPTEEQKAFGWQLVHICQNIQYLHGRVIMSGAEEESAAFELVAIPEDATDKAAVLACLESHLMWVAYSLARFDDVQMDTRLSFFAGKHPRLAVYLLIRDHITHHRGQLVVYLRLQGVAPPRYVGW